MLKLTDEERATIKAVYGHDYAHGQWDEMIYLAGMRAGMLRAAVICDDIASSRIDSVAADCAAAIREGLVHETD